MVNFKGCKQNFFSDNMTSMGACYLSLPPEVFEDKIKKLYNLLNPCRLCPHYCGVNRLGNEKGYCRAGNKPVVSSYAPHLGEEPPIRGIRGSGTIFFTYCNLRCIYCQNYTISQLGEGEEIEVKELKRIMLWLQSLGCHNINLVTPTHQIPFIAEAVYLARQKGLNIPIVYNSGGYDSIETLKLLEGIIDIYMPDFKYFDDVIAERLSGCKNYVEVAKTALKEMHRQVGDLVINPAGIAEKGLLVRHLVLPENLAGTDRIIQFISQEISKDTYLNIMDQYYPCFKVNEYPPLCRRISHKELNMAIGWAQEAGLTRFIY